MRSVFTLVVGLVLGVALGAFGYDHFVAAPERARAAYALEDQQRQMARFDPTMCSRQREVLVQEFEACIHVTEENNAALQACQTKQASAGLPVPGKKK